MIGQMTRDQRRAQYAYQCAGEVMKLGDQQRQEYRTLVMGLGPLVLRSGLVTALAFLQRRAKDEDRNAAAILFEHLASADIPGLRPDRGEAPEQICALARHLELEPTMLATRELIKVVEWLKRAAEATLPSEHRT